MIDPKLLRTSAADVAKNLARRNFDFDVAEYDKLEDQRKSLQVEVENLRSERNASSRRIGKAKGQGEDITPLLAAVESLGAKLEDADGRLGSLQVQLKDIELGLPNLLHDDVPVGADEDDNQEVLRWGEPRQFDFEPLDHVDIGAGLGTLDFDAATKISGSRFVVMQGSLARLQRALIQFMLDMHTTEHGYEEIYVPYLVQSEALIGTGQLPKFEDDQFKTTDLCGAIRLSGGHPHRTGFDGAGHAEAERRRDGWSGTGTSHRGLKSTKDRTCSSGHWESRLGVLLAPAFFAFAAVTR